MKIKFSPQFERDYQFYLSQKDTFTFSGSDIKSDFGIQFPGDLPGLDEEEKEIPFNITYSEAGKNAKICFYKIDSEGKCGSCSEPQLLVELLTCKASVNLQIKMWAQGRAEYTLPAIELQEYCNYYQTPEWVFKAVEKQKDKIIRQWMQDKNSYADKKDTLYYHMTEAIEDLSNNKGII
jgi:hypothetical protein